MTGPTVIAPGEGEVLGDAPDRRVELLADHEALHVTWTRFGPRRDGADLHVHRRHTDLFYVLAGEFTARLGPAGDEIALAAGNLIRLPPMVVHGFRNASDGELRFLNLHAPGEGFADYMRGLRDGRKVDFDQWDPPEDGGRPVSEATIGPLEQPVEVEGLVISEVTGDAGFEHGWLFALEDGRFLGVELRRR